MRQTLTLSKKTTIIISLICLFLLYWFLHARTPSTPPAPSNSLIPAITVAPVLKTSIAPTITFPGKVLSPKIVNLRPRIDGQLMRVFFKEGENVKKDQLLFQLDDASLQAQLAQAQATLERDKANYAFAQTEMKRTDTLAKREIASLSKLQQDEATAASALGTVHIAQAAVDLIKIQIDYTRITSPLDGQIGFRSVDPGDLIRIADNITLATVVQLDPIQVQFSVPEQYLALLQQRAKATETTAASPLRLYFMNRRPCDQTGTVFAIENQVDTAYGTLNVKGQFPNPHHTLTPGQYVTVEMILYTEDDALTLPVEALQTGQSSTYVYVYNPQTQTVQYRALKADIIDDKVAKVSQGLAAGEQVVLSGHLKLTEGMKVRVVEMPKKSS